MTCEFCGSQHRDAIEWGTCCMSHGMLNGSRLEPDANGKRWRVCPYCEQKFQFWVEMYEHWESCLHAKNHMAALLLVNGRE